MQLHQLTADLSVSPQLTIENIAQAAAAGFKAIICNRPDLEGEGQPSSDEMQAACVAAGLNWYFLPVSPRDYTNQQGREFGELLLEIEGPVLAYCRTGTRSTNLWALSQAGSAGVDSILQTAQTAGYDLSKLKQRILSLEKE